MNFSEPGQLWVSVVCFFFRQRQAQQRDNDARETGRLAAEAETRAQLESLRRERDAAAEASTKVATPVGDVLRGPPEPINRRHRLLDFFLLQNPMQLLTSFKAFFAVCQTTIRDDTLREVSEISTF